MTALSRRPRFAWSALLAGILAIGCGAPQDAAAPAAPEANISANLAAPPLGWNSWNTFAEAIDYNTIKAQADAMVSSGMKDAGYQYVNLDAGWWLGTRDSQGNITVDTSKWPGGMAAIADYIHSKGLKAGIYTDAGKNGCIYWWPTNGPKGPGTGSEGHYDQDFLQFSKWGFDYVKVDWCGGRDEGLNAQQMYTQLSASIDRAVAQTGRPMVLSVCEWGSNSPWNWAPAISSLWRTSDDIIFFGSAPSMTNVFRNYDSALHPSAQSPGHYNDPDMLMVGMSGFSGAQNRTHIALWAMISAPLIAGNNLATMSSDTRAVLTNKDMLSINQDPLGRQATKVAEDQSGLQVWSKVLSGTGRRAVLLLNRNTSTANITVRWANLGFTTGSASVRNVWTGTDLGAISTSYTASVAGRDSVLLLVTEGGTSTYTLTVTKSGTGSGTVTSSVGGINCGSTCTAAPASGTTVTLTATAAAGSTFAGWSGACTGTGTCVVTMTASRTATATFNAPQQVGPMSINAGGAAAGTFVADVNFSGGSTYTTTNAIDTTQITGAVPPQSVFQSERYGEFTYTIPGLTAGGSYAVTLYFEESYWTAAGQRTFNVAINGTNVLTAFDIYAAAGGSNKAIARSFNATADASGQLVVAFTKGGGPDNPKVCGLAVAGGPTPVPYTLTVTKAGAGSGTVAGGGISCGTACATTLGSGTTVTLTASPATGSAFAGWGGACVGTGSCVVTMTANQAVTATFDTSGPTTYSLGVTKNGTGAGTVAGGPIDCGSTCSAASLASGTTVTLTAAAATGSTFAGWGGACAGTSTCVVTLTANQTVTATFNVVTTGNCTTATGGQSGNFNTTGAACYTVNATIHGWGCSNADGRTVTVNGTAVTCGQMPLPGASPYTFSFTAGSYPWASFYWW